jgi:hypothetical protein
MRTEMGKLEILVKNDELVEFMREFTSAGGFRGLGWSAR